MIKYLLPFLLFAMSVYSPTMAQNYHLFHPVPKNQLREFESDRPNITESPYTVDAGHFQYEADLVKFSRTRTETESEHLIMINQANLKIGIAHSTSIQLNWETYDRDAITDLSSGDKTVTHGSGDLILRIKQNLVGNDKGDFALAVLPYVTFPIASYQNDPRYEFGLLIPMQYQLPGEWKLGMQLEVDRRRNEIESGLHTELLQSLAISHPLVKQLDGLAETHYTYDIKHHQWTNFLNAAIQWKVAANLLLDTGLNYGIQTGAERNYFIGCSLRL